MKSFPEGAASGIDALLVAMRPKLHRYCARMVGSVIDGEDVLQDALIKAVAGFPAAAPLDNPEAWLFRIAQISFAAAGARNFFDRARKRT